MTHPDGGENDLFCFTTVFGADYTTPLATVVIEIATEKWIGGENDAGEDKSFLILDKDLTPIIERGAADAGFGERLLEVAPPEEGRIYFDKAGDRIALYMKSAQNDWIYMYMINNDSYTAVINSMRRNTGALMLLWLAVGICITWFFVRRQHRPVRHLVSRLEKNTGMSFSESERDNEFIFINDWITRLIEEKNRDDDEIAHFAVIAYIFPPPS